LSRRQRDRRLDDVEPSEAIVSGGGGGRLLMGEGESRQDPAGTDMLTSAFAESTRAPRPAAAA
jgi:hypothetical protein